MKEIESDLLLRFHFGIRIYAFQFSFWTDTPSPKWNIHYERLKKGWLLKVFTYRLTFWVSWIRK